MTTPFTNVEDAFDVFFNETIAVKTPDGKSTPLRAAVFTDGMGDPLTDDMMDSQREEITFVFLKDDWPFVKTLKRGATITRCLIDKTYAVSEAKLDNCLGWCVTAREK